MAKFQSPLLGYNNNVRHKGRVFHIQTEDSGVNHPHIITHLFMDGGRILKSVKKSYAEHIGTDGMSEVVRQMMKEQHKAMFIALRDGQFDHIVDPTTAAKPAPAAAAAPPAAEAAAPVAPPRAPAVEVAAAAPATETVIPATSPESAPAGSRVEGNPPSSGVEAAAAAAFANAAVAARSNPPPAAAHADAKAPSAPPQPKRETAAAKIAGTPRLLLQVESDHPPVTTPEQRAPVDVPPSVRELTLDFDALERESGQGPSLFHAMDLPPPPKNLFAKERGTGAYRAVEDEVPRSDPRAESLPPASGRHQASIPASGPRGSQPAQRIAGQSSPKSMPARPAGPPSDGRYAPARPAAIFGSSNAAPKPPPQSIFSDELVSDKSLDEVILSYLAEDLEPPRRK